ncbi:MAG: MFS transporter [Ruminococcaceae bacterium]|nr:MFS transporter [Oscillospiraceae bacterium]
MQSKIFGKKNWYILILFGMIGQIAWAVENMYFNMFVFDTVAPNLSAITLMVQLSGITATVVTLVAGTLSDMLGNRRAFISWGYVIWGITVAIFGFLSPNLISKLFGIEHSSAVYVTLVMVIVGDCVMTFFGSCANDAAFNAWVTDNTETEYRGKVEGIIAILPLIAMLAVAGGFGILVEGLGYAVTFAVMGAFISLSGVIGIFVIKDSPSLSRSGSMRDIIYGFKPSIISANRPLYIALLIVLVYGIACQIFMPYLIIYMKSYLGFSVLEYSAVFAIAILLGAALNIYLTRLSDKKDKAKMLYLAAGIFASGLFMMYFVRGIGKGAMLVLFGVAGFIMICGNILISALAGSLVRDYTPEGEAGKLQGVRMVFSVLVPMLVGPMIGNAVNSMRKIPLPDAETSPDAMTTSYIPAPEIFLVAAIAAVLLFAIIPFFKKSVSKK